MRPARTASRWVKIRSWFYTERRVPTRAVSDAEAIRSDWAALAGDVAAVMPAKDDHDLMLADPRIEA